MNAPTSASLFSAAIVGCLAIIGCGGAGTTSARSTAPGPTPSSAIRVAAGFTSQTIATVPKPRELVGLPNGDLLVGTSGASLYLVPGAENSGAAKPAHVFVTLADSPAQGIALSADGSTIYAATEYDVFRIAYKSGDQSEPSSDAQQIASIRTGPTSGWDHDLHITSSVAASSTALYVGVGSSCNACVEADPTRATIQAMNLDGSGMHTFATRFRNAIALATDPANGALWAGGAGQDWVAYGHPYEFMDDVSAQSGSPVDYGWPDCEENHVAYTHGANCANVAVPQVEFPAYATHIGAAFYPSGGGGTYAFPASYRGGLFVASHGSWHCCPSTAPEVAFVPMSGGAPATPVNWNDPTVQWSAFMWNFGDSSSTNYIGRPTGVAVGSQGSLFVADDGVDAIYRIRPSAVSKPRS
jgi:glucose/arabinose dehydrogenase